MNGNPRRDPNAGAFIFWMALIILVAFLYHNQSAHFAAPPTADGGVAAPAEQQNADSDDGPIPALHGRMMTMAVTPHFTDTHVLSTAPDMRPAITGPRNMAPPIATTAPSIRTTRIHSRRAVGHMRTSRVATATIMTMIRSSDDRA